MSLLLDIAWVGRLHGLPTVLCQPRLDDGLRGVGWLLGGAPVAWIPTAPAGGPSSELLMFAFDDVDRLADFVPGRAVGLLPADPGVEVTRTMQEALLQAAADELERADFPDPPGSPGRPTLLRMIRRNARFVGAGDDQARSAMSYVFDVRPRSMWEQLGGSRALGASLHRALADVPGGRRRGGYGEA